MKNGRVAVLSGVGVRYGDTPVLGAVDFELSPGEAVGLLGPNGSGKTTLLRVLATLVAPSAGTGTVLGADLGTTARLEVRSRIGLVGHLPALYPELTLHENLAFVARLAGRSPGRVEEALAAVGLAGAAGRRADHASKGMLRRAEFARVLLTGPELLLLDEAHAGLDESAAGLVPVLVARTVARDGAAVVVSHEPERLAGVVSRSVVVDGGTVGAA